MLKQRPRFTITHPNWYQVRVHVDNIKSHFIEPATDIGAERDNPHWLEFDAEHLEFINYLVADNNNYCPVAECMQGDVHSPNPMQRDSNPANE
jgi:hypothetical protein